MSQNDGIEQPIYIESLQRQRDHRYVATNGDAEHRIPIRREEIWNDYTSIPDDPTALNLINDGDAVGNVALRKQKALTAVVGTTHKFQLAAPGDLSFVIPATFGQSAPLPGGSTAPTIAGSAATGYQPVIVDSNGTVHPQEPSSWVVDGVNNYVEFPYGVPPTMVAPFTLTYVQYTGAFGGAGGVSPAILDLWVSTAGNDATGDGTMTNPYLTIDRALQDARDIGWNDSASVTIDAAGGNFVFPVGDVSFNAGARGAQRTPMVIKGSTRTTVAAGATVAAAALNPSSGLVEMTGSAMGVPGERVRFTSGPLSTISLGGFFATAVQGDFAIAANYAGGQSARLPYSDTAPGVGDTYDVERFDTLVDLTGVTKIRADGNQIVFEDLIFLVHGAQGGFVVQNTLVGTLGVNMVADPGTQVVALNVDAGWHAGLVKGYGQRGTTKSLYVDTTAAGSQLVNLGLVTAPRHWANVVVRGDAGAGDAVAPIALSGVVQQSYWENTGPIRPAPGTSLNIRSFHIDSSRGVGAFSIDDGSVFASQGLINAPVNDGVHVSASGRFQTNATAALSSGVVIVNAGRRGVHAFEGGEARMLAENGSITGSGAEGVLVDGGGAFWCENSACDFSGSGASGILVRDGGRAYIGAALTTNNCGDRGIHLINGALMTVTGNVASDGNAQECILVEKESRLAVAGDVAVGNNAAAATISADTSAEIHVAGDVSCTNSASSGIACNHNSNVGILGTLTTTGGQVGLNIAASTLKVGGNVTATGATGGSNLSCSAGTVVVSGTATLTGANGRCLSLTSGSTMAVTGGLDTSNSVTSFGTDIAASKLTVDGAFTSNNNPLVGLHGRPGSVIICGALTTDNNTQQGALLLDSEAVVRGNLTCNGNGFQGMNAATSVLKCGGVTNACTGNGQQGLLGNGAEILLANGLVASGNDTLAAGLAGVDLNLGTQLDIFQGNLVPALDVGASGLHVTNSSTLNIQLQDPGLAFSINAVGRGVAFSNILIADRGAVFVGSQAGATIITAPIVATGALNGLDNIFITQGSELTTSGSAVNASGSSGRGVVVENGSKLNIDANAAGGIALDVSGATVVDGLVIRRSTVIVDGDAGPGPAPLVRATDVTNTGITVEQSTVSINGAGLVDVGNSTGIGGNTGLLVDASSAVDLLNNLGVNAQKAAGATGDGIVVRGQSSLRSSGRLNAAACSSGVRVENNSMLHVAATGANAIIATGTLTGPGVVVGLGSRLMCRGGSIDASATVSANSIRVTDGASLDASDVDASGNGAGGGGFAVTTARASLAGRLTASGCSGSGVNATLNSQLTVAGSTTNSNGSSGILLVESEFTSGGAVVSNSNGGAGLLASLCEVHILGTLTADSNTGSNVGVTNSEVNISGQLTTNGSSLSGGLLVSSSRVTVSGVESGRNATSGIVINEGSMVRAAGVLASGAGPNVGGVGVEVRSGAKFVSVGGNVHTMTGGQGDCQVGLNASPATWALIAGRRPNHCSDFTPGTGQGGRSEMCIVSYS